MDWVAANRVRNRGLTVYERDDGLVHFPKVKSDTEFGRCPSIKSPCFRPFLETRRSSLSAVARYYRCNCAAWSCSSKLRPAGGFLRSSITQVAFMLLPNGRGEM